MKKAVNNFFRRHIKNYSIYDIVCRFIRAEVLFDGGAYSNHYDLLNNCCDNKAGKDEYHSLLSFFIVIKGNMEVELKLYFEEKRLYTDAIRFFSDNCPVLADFLKELNRVNFKVYVPKAYPSNWLDGLILLDGVKIIYFDANEKLRRYEITQLQNAPVGEKYVESCLGMINYTHKEIAFNELKTSFYWDEYMQPADC